jgi:hypothetical protein
MHPDSKPGGSPPGFLVLKHLIFKGLRIYLLTYVEVNGRCTLILSPEVRLRVSFF